MLISSIAVSTICIIGGGILYNSSSDDISNPPKIAIENLDILEEKIPTIVEQLNYQEIEPPKIDVQKERHRLFEIDKEVALLTEEADLFIKENKLSLPEEALSEKNQLATQEQINTALSKLDSLESQLDSYAQQ